MKKTLKKRAFISAIAMLIVSAIVLTSSTFAWFAMATKVNVDSMELNITSLDGIVFSANTTNFTTALTTDDLKNDQSSVYRYGAYVGNTNNLSEKLSPVSTLCYTANQFPTFYSGSIDPAGLLTVKLETKDNKKTSSDIGKGFVAFDLFIKVATNETVTWTSDLSVNDGDIVDPLYAMRVAVVNCGMVAEKADATTILGVTPSAAAAATIWEMDTKKHGSTSGVEDGTELITNPMASAVTTYNLKNAGDDHTLTTADYTKINVYGQFKTRDDVKTFSVTPGVTKLRVYIWLEGNDVDCESAIAGSIVKCGLQFSIVG